MPGYNWLRLRGVGLSGRFAELTCWAGRDNTDSYISFETTNLGLPLKLMDDAGRSRFLQVIDSGSGSGKKLSVNVGESSVHFPGSVESNWSAEIAHGLGVVPAFIGITSVYADSGRIVGFIDRSGYPTATVFRYFARDMVGLNHGPGPIYQYWVAIG